MTAAATRQAYLDAAPPAGAVRRCNRHGCLAVACDQSDGAAPDLRFPIYAVIRGHRNHGNHMWLTEGEVFGWQYLTQLETSACR